MRLQDVLVSADLMSHAIRVTEVADRREFFSSLVSGQRVLHVGCCDVPVFLPETNLHLALARVTPYLDGLDVSESGIAVLKQHVGGRYYTSPEHIDRDYDIVLVPEVLEHTRDAESFLKGIFGIVARQYIITAPSFEWFKESRRDGNIYIERVHGDHKAWYSPYTLLNTLRPFIDEESDEVEVFMTAQMGSVGVIVQKWRELRQWQPTASRVASGEETLSLAMRLCEDGLAGEALELLRNAYESSNELKYAYQEIGLRLGLGQHLEALRRSVEVMRKHPEQAQLLYLAAEASEHLGDPAQAEELRTLARSRERGGR